MFFYLLISKTYLLYNILVKDYTTGVVKIKTMGCQRSVEAMLAVIYPFLKIYVQFQSLKLNSFYMRNCTVTYIETVQFRTPKLYSLGSVH